MRETRQAGTGRYTRRWGTLSAVFLCAFLGTLFGAFLVVSSCSVPPESSWPPGVLLGGDARELDRLAAGLETLSGTPLAALAGRLRARLGQVEMEGEPSYGFLLHRPPEAKESLEAYLHRRPEEAWLPALRELRGDADFAFALPAAAEGRLLGTGELAEDGSLALSAWTTRDVGEGPLGLLLPGAGAVGAAVLDREEAVFHVRVRSDRGLDLAELIPEEGDVDRMFRLKSRLFSSLVLDGVWELAVYAPPLGRQMPQVVLALGIKDRGRALQAVEEFLADVEDRWPVRRVPYQLPGTQHRGECLGNAQVMPELAPCWLALDEAVVFSWNSESLERALHRAVEPSETAPGTATLSLDRLPEADRVLAATLGRPGSGAPPPLRWPWERLELRGRRDGDLYRFDVQLLAAGPAVAGSAP